MSACCLCHWRVDEKWLSLSSKRDFSCRKINFSMHENIMSQRLWNNFNIMYLDLEAFVILTLTFLLFSLPFFIPLQQRNRKFPTPAEEALNRERKWKMFWNASYEHDLNVYVKIMSKVLFCNFFLKLLSVLLSVY